MPDPVNPLASIDPFSRSVVHLTMYFSDPDSPVESRQELATATGFVRQKDNQYFLITARHNLTGRDPDTNEPISCSGGVPNEVDIEGSGNRKRTPLYESPNNPNDSDHCPPLFRQHPTDSRIDVAILPFTGPSDWGIAWDERLFKELLNTFVELSVMQTCFVVGFPLGLVDRPAPNFVVPIYKAAHIASEPHLDFQDRPIVVIDATTRPGMSGSPVLIRRGFSARSRYGFVGIYTGRFPRLQTRDDPALGIVYKPKVIWEIFESIPP